MEILELVEALEQAQELRERGGAAIVHVVRNTGGVEVNPSAKLVISSSGQTAGRLPEAIEQAAVSAARGALNNRTSRSFSLHPTEGGGEIVGMQGGEVDVFVEVLPPSRSLLILGAGHIAQPLAELGKLLRLSVTVLDDRPQFANRDRFPTADEIVVADFESGLEHVRIDRDTYAVLVTRGHVHDFAALRRILKTDVAYIGMIGSKVRVRTVFDHLKEEGFNMDDINRVYAPIGIDIGSQTPEEIAVAIAGEIVNVCRKGNARHLRLEYKP